MQFSVKAGGAMVGELVKHPLAEVLVYVDWTPYLLRQQTMIEQSAWVADNGLVLVAPFLSAGVASVELGGGEPATIAYAENRVTFADRSRDVFRVRVALTGTQ